MFHHVMCHLCIMYHLSRLIEDFILQPDSQHRDILHVRNAPSPAATASITRGEHVVKEAATLFGW